MRFRRGMIKKKAPSAQHKQHAFKSGREILDSKEKDPISARLEENVHFVEELLGDNEDLVIRHFRVLAQYDAVIIYLSNFSDEENINIEILRSLMGSKEEDPRLHSNELLKTIYEDVLYYSDASIFNSKAELIRSIIRGNSVILIEGASEAIIVGTRLVGKRAVEQPPTEQVIRGPRDGFIEQLDTNISLLRYRLLTPDLTIESMRIGRISDSKVVICHLKGIASEELVQEVKNRLSRIEIDGVLDAGYLEQMIEDNRFSPFPQIQFTERPDKAVAQLLEGRVMVMVDGSPFALIMPAVFSQFYQTTEDYSERFLMGTLVRLIRFIAIIFALVFPALYVAVISFNPELIPTDFAVAIAGASAGVAFPVIIEVLVMEIAMEVLREATIRLPQQVGGALSIVGVLVIGQAAVAAGFSSPITVVVIALTTIGSFATPAYNAAIALRMLRFPLLLLAGTFGLYGVMVGLILVVNHMLSLRSFGVPYMVPFVPGSFQGMKDSLIRGPLWWLKTRPSFLDKSNIKRIDDSELSQTYIGGQYVSSTHEDEGGDPLDDENSTRSNPDPSSDHPR